MRVYILIWIVVTAILGFEYFALAKSPAQSLLLQLQRSGWIDASIKLNTEPGAWLSVWLGWIGFGAMIVMNVYSLRKRATSLSGWGDIRSWLNFHIFCGLLGPSLILFHSGLKVRGVVGIAFWSMVVSFSSGIIGRYFYAQLLRRKVDYEKAAEKWLERLRESIRSAKAAEDENVRQAALRSALRFVGATEGDESPGVVSVFVRALVGDIRLLFTDPKIPPGWPNRSRYILSEYALNVRRGRSLSYFERLMGLWHAFHFPFAVFMYLAAVIHVISSLIFLRAN